MLLIKNIASVFCARAEADKPLRGVEMERADRVDNAWLTVDGERIAAWGSMEELPSESGFTRVIDARGGYVLPTFCDSHTHLVYA